MDLSVKPSIIKNSIKSAFGRGPFSTIARRYAGSVTCLMYHSLVEPSAKLSEFDPYSGLRVLTTEFEKQMGYLAQHYRVIPITEALERFETGEHSAPAVVISFDDGYLDNLTLGLPILEKYKLPAVIYVTSGFMDRTACLWWEESARMIQRSQDIALDWKGARLSWKTNTPEEKLRATYEVDSILKACSVDEISEFLDLMCAGKGTSSFQKLC